MARPMNQNSAKRQAHLWFPDFLAQREQAKVYDVWARGEQENSLYVPKHYNTNDEYQDLIDRSPTNWLGLGISSLVQTIFLDGVKRQGSNDVLKSYDNWRKNRFNSRQNPLYRGAMAHGQSFVLSIPGEDRLTNEPMSIWRGLSALTTAAWYEYPGDEWCLFALHAEEDFIVDGNTPGWTVELIDEVAIYRFTVKGNGENLNDWEYVTTEEHDSGCPRSSSTRTPPTSTAGTPARSSPSSRWPSGSTSRCSTG